MVYLVRFLLFLVLSIIYHSNFIFPALDLFNYLVNQSIIYFLPSLFLEEIGVTDKTLSMAFKISLEIVIDWIWR